MNTTVTLGELLQDYEQQELTVLEPGTYEAEIVHVKPRDTDVQITYKLVSGPYVGKRFMAGTISWKGNAGPRSFQRMREVGLDKDWFQQAGGANLPLAELMRILASALTGRVVGVELTTDEWKEETRNKLVKFTGLISAPAAQPAQGVPAVPAPAPVATVPPVTAEQVAPAPVAAPPPAPAPVAATPAPVASEVSPVPVAAPPPVPAPSAAPQPVTATPPVAVQGEAVQQVPAGVPGVPVAAPAPPPAEAAPAVPAAVPAAPAAGTVSVDEPDF